jgi:MSHA biogenesis protein MshP
MSRKARGFAMPVIIALVVVFATILGTALVTISSSQHVGSALDIEGVRAYHAARAGLEWGMYHALRTGMGGCAGVNGVNNKWVVFGGNLSGFRAELQCQATVHREGGVNVNMYTIIATACNAADCAAGSTAIGYVNRQLRATVSK